MRARGEPESAARDPLLAETRLDNVVILSPLAAAAKQIQRPSPNEVSPPNHSSPVPPAADGGRGGVDGQPRLRARGRSKPGRAAAFESERGYSPLCSRGAVEFGIRHCPVITYFQQESHSGAPGPLEGGLCILSQSPSNP